jgi:hypothetical protein
MIVSFNGQIIQLDINDTVSRVEELTCTMCGHELGKHVYNYSLGNPNVWITGLCRECGLTENKRAYVCPQFRHTDGTF